MKILQIGKFYPIHGGVEKVMYDLATGLSEREIRCDLLFASADGHTFTIKHNKHCDILRTHTLAKVKATMIAPAMILRLRKIANNYDIIHVHHPDPMAALALRLSGFKGKIVVHWHSDILKQKIILKFYRPLQSWVLRKACRIVGTTPVYLNESPWLKKYQDKTHVMPIGINPVTPDERGAANIRARFGDKKIILSLGRLVPYKGFDTLIEAATHLSDDYVILIGGRGPMHERLAGKIKQLGLENKVHLLGFIPDERLAAYITASKIFCLSSVFRTEAFAIVQIESMSAGRPVAATRIPGSGVSWVNKHEYSGLNVEPGDAKATAKAIEQICDNEQTWQEYCQRARQRYTDNFRYEKMIDNCEQLYKDILHE